MNNYTDQLRAICARAKPKSNIVILKLIYDGYIIQRPLHECSFLKEDISGPFKNLLNKVIFYGNEASDPSEGKESVINMENMMDRIIYTADEVIKQSNISRKTLKLFKNSMNYKNIEWRLRLALAYLDGSIGTEALELMIKKMAENT